MIFTQSNIRGVLFVGIIFLPGIQSAAAQNGTASVSNKLDLEFKSDGQNYGPGFGTSPDGTKNTVNPEAGTDLKFDNLRISAVPVPVVTVIPPIAPGIFHLVLNALPDSAMPPVSPFVVEPGESVPPPIGNHSPGTLTGSPNRSEEHTSELQSRQYL